MDLLSYERDSRWKPHLSWTYPDWTLQQRMETQAQQREQAWQRIVDKLGPLLAIGPHEAIGGSSSFGQSDYIVRDIDDQHPGLQHQVDTYPERAYEKAPLLNAGPEGGPYRVRPPAQSLSMRSSGESEQQLYGTRRHRYNDSLKTQSPPFLSWSPSPQSSQASRPSKQHNHHYHNYHNYNTCNQHTTPIAPPLQTPTGARAPQQQEKLKAGAQNFCQRQMETPYQSRAQIIDVIRLHQSEQRHKQSMKRAKRRCWTVSAIIVLLTLFLFTIVALMGFGVIQYKTFARYPH